MDKIIIIVALVIALVIVATGLAWVLDGGLDKAAAIERERTAQERELTRQAQIAAERDAQREEDWRDNLMTTVALINATWAASHAQSSIAFGLVGIVAGLVVGAWLFILLSGVRITITGGKQHGS